jgi:hypothetical protein
MKGHLSSLLPVAGTDAADTNAVKAAATARTIEKRIVCEDVI